MIKKIITKEYSVVCDDCGEERFPPYDDAYQAMEDAKKDGWEIYDKSMRPPMAMCPSCRKKAGDKA